LRAYDTALAVFFLAAMTACSFRGMGGTAPADSHADGIKILTLSGQPQRVSGGDALIRIDLPHRTSFSATLNGKDITGAFRANGGTTSYLGLIKPLKNGENALEVRAADHLRASLTLTNYPIQGPIVSGPHIQPFICETEHFALPDGRTLGPALDAIAPPRPPSPMCTCLRTPMP